VKRTARWIALLLAIALVTGCAERRATKMVEKAQDLARHGKYDEAITMLQEVERRFADTEQARGTRKLIVLYSGLRDAELKEDRRRAKDELTAIARALFIFHDRYGRYPATLRELPAGDSLPLTDPWGSDYRYLPLSGGRRYRLECRGKDGRVGGTGDDQDLLIVNGEFVADLPWADR
jgi:hypothetical protein